MLNLQLALTTSFVAGDRLDSVRIKIRDFIWKMLSKKNLAFVGPSILLHSQTVALIEGLHILEAGRIENNIPSESEVLSDAVFVITKQIHLVVRAFLFRQLDDVSYDVNLIDTILKKHQLRPILLMGVFFGGLLSFQYAHQSKNAPTTLWMEKGEYVLMKMTCFNEHSKHNWENKMLLLGAEKMNILGEFDQAESLYISSIRSAKEHNFLHEEAIASELAGEFFFARGFRQKSLELLLHAERCYERWGASAVARRVEKCVEIKFGSDHAKLRPIDDILQGFFSLEGGSSNKRRGVENNYA